MNKELYPTVKEYPFGIHVELVRLSTLVHIYQKTLASDDLEHVTPYIYNHPSEFNIHKIIVKEKPQISSSINTQEDLRRVRGYWKKGIIK